jgi:hypothetical protein
LPKNKKLIESTADQFVALFFGISLQMSPQPVCNCQNQPNPKHSRQHSPLVVVVYRAFSPTTTKEKPTFNWQPKSKVTASNLALIRNAYIFCEQSHWQVRSNDTHRSQKQWQMAAWQLRLRFLLLRLFSISPELTDFLSLVLGSKRVT